MLENKWTKQSIVNKIDNSKRTDEIEGFGLKKMKIWIGDNLIWEFQKINTKINQCFKQKNKEYFRWESQLVPINLFAIIKFIVWRMVLPAESENHNHVYE